MTLQRAAKYPKAGRGLGKMIHMTEAERAEVKAWHLQSIDGPTPEERRQRDSQEAWGKRRAAEGKRPETSTWVASSTASARQNLGRRWA